jgi:hypothetical protein
MDVVRIICIINFFFFLLVLILLWNKMYLVTEKITEVVGIINKCNSVALVPEESAKLPEVNQEGSWIKAL